MVKLSQDVKPPRLREVKRSHRSAKVVLYMSLAWAPSILSENTRYWTLAFGANWLYGNELGYDVRYLSPKTRHHEYGARKIGWAKVMRPIRFSFYFS